MTTHFSRRLPSNDGDLQFSKGAAITFLRAYALVAPTFLAAGTVAELWEYCAALLWVRGPGYFSQTLRGLPPGARITLCTVLVGVSTHCSTQPFGVQATSDRIHQAVLSRSPGPAPAGAAQAAAAAAPPGAGGIAGAAGEAQADRVPAGAVPAGGFPAGAALAVATGGAARRARPNMGSFGRCRCAGAGCWLAPSLCSPLM
jgi:hypothetical protein